VVDATPVDPGGESARLLANGFRFPSQRRLLVLGTVNSWKGIDTVIRALSLVVGEFTDLQLDVVGDAMDKALLAELQDLARTCGVVERVHFLPHVDQVDSTIRGACCVVSASVPWNGGPETFGRTVVESWAYLRPVIASRFGGPETLIEEKTDGLLFDPGDPEDLARALRALLRDPEEMWRLAVNGRRKFVHQFSATKVSARFLELLEELRGDPGADAESSVQSSR